MRTLQITLIAFVGATSTLLGLLLMAHPVIYAYGFSLHFLRPDLSENLVLPGLLFTAIGSLNLVALYTWVQKNGNRYILTLAGSFLIIIWVIIDAVILKTMPWLYVIYLISSLLIILLTLKLKGKWAY